MEATDVFFRAVCTFPGVVNPKLCWYSFADRLCSSLRANSTCCCVLYEYVLSMEIIDQHLGLFYAFDSSGGLSKRLFYIYMYIYRYGPNHGAGAPAAASIS